MDKVKRKLADSSGMTILVALLAFIVAAAVSFTIVAAAINNESRVRGQQKGQQEYLLATSSATLLEKEIAGTTITCKAYLTLDGSAAAENYDPPAYTLSKHGSDALGAALTALTKPMLNTAWNEARGTPAADQTLVLEAEFPSGSGLDTDEAKVQAVLKGDLTGRKITAVITPQASAAGGESVRLLSLDFAGLNWTMKASEISALAPDGGKVLDEDGLEVPQCKIVTYQLTIDPKFIQAGRSAAS